MDNKGQIPSGLSGFGAASPAPQASSAAMQSAAPMPGQETQQADEKEQNLYENFVAGAASLIFDEKARPAMEKALMLDQPGETPGEGLALAASVAAIRAGEQLSKSINGPIPNDIIASGMEEIVGQVAEYGEKIGAVKEYSDQDMQNGYIGAMDQTRLALVESGAITKDAAEADLAELKERGADNLFAGMGAGPDQAPAEMDKEMPA